MTNEEAIQVLHHIVQVADTSDCGIKEIDGLDEEALDMAIKALEQETNIKSLGEDLRICQKSITDEKVLIGFNMAVSLCNKYFAGSEVQK